MNLQVNIYKAQAITEGDADGAVYEGELIRVKDEFYIRPTSGPFACYPDREGKKVLFEAMRVKPETISFNGSYTIEDL